MNLFILILFFCSLGILSYAWIGYPLLLWLLTVFSPSSRLYSEHNDFTPSVSIVLSAYNEEDVIEKRLENLYVLDYPRDKMEVIVASDGSVDDTVDRCRHYSSIGCNVLEFEKNRGKAMVHNDSIAQAKGDIIIITDADTIFEKDFLRKIVQPFQDSEVGCTTGNLKYTVTKAGVASSESLYWRYETLLRRMESKIGLLSNASGACMAFRRALFRKLTDVDDTDTATVIDIILDGHRLKWVEDATAYDIPPHTARSSFLVKIRGTSKTLVSYTRRGSLKRWSRRPGLVWTVFSHRFLRYLTPYFLLILFGMNFMLRDAGRGYHLFLVIQVIGCLLLLIGGIADLFGKRIPLASSVYAFGVALCGMAVGVWVALFGTPPTTHKTDDSF